MDETVPEPSKIYLQLRNGILDLKPEDVGIAPSIEAPHVWGVIMETSYEVGSATLVSLADGTTSLYYSTGGGMLGSGDYTPVAEASKGFIAEAEVHLSKLPPSTDHPLPEVGWVRFIILTYSGMRSEVALLDKLATGSHPLSLLFTRAQNTLSQLRQSAEKKRNKT
jgi:hypothetical protein